MLVCAPLAARAATTPTGVGPSPPPLPPQPALAPPGHTSCPITAQPPGTWRRISEVSSASNPFPPQQVVVDPWSPCLMYRALDSQNLERSTDGGATWQPAFHDSASGTYADPVTGTAAPVDPSLTAFRGTDLVVPRAGGLLLAENGNGDAVAGTGDGGHSWRLLDDGIGGLPVERLVVAPSDADVVYAVLGEHTPLTLQGMPAGATPYSVAMSRDGGRTWAGAGALPLTAENPQSLAPWVQVDPADPTHLWAVVLTGEEMTLDVAVVLESTDGAATWHEVGTLNVAAGPATGTEDVVSQLVAVRSPRHGTAVRLLVLGVFADGVTMEMSDDGGRTWNPARVPLSNVPNADASLAWDPLHPDHMMLVSAATGGATAFFFSYDAFDNAIAMQPARSPAVPAAPEAPWVTAQEVAATTIAQADRFGGFYAALSFGCGKTARPDCPYANGAATAFYRFTPPAGDGGAQSGGGASPLGLAPVPMALAKQCATPEPTTGSGRGINALAYDGQSLLYGVVTQPAPPDQVHIKEIDPVTCNPRALLVVRFRDGDLRLLAQGNDYRDGAAPEIGYMAYDRSRGALWLTLDTGSGYVFSVDLSTLPVLPPHPQPLTGGAPSLPTRTLDATLQFHAGWGCGGYLGYDPSDDGLWTCDGQGGKREYRMQDGTPTANLCDVGGMVWPTEGDSAVYGGPETWTVVGPHRLLMQVEQDTNVYDVDTSTCSTTAAYVHGTSHVETADGDDPEAMDCDPLTFAPGSSAGGLAGGPVMWIREGTSTSSSITAYVLPTAQCQLWTDTRYTGVRTAVAGSSITLCAVLTQHHRSIAVGGRTLSVRFDGVSVAVPPTSSDDGSACGTVTAPPVAGAHQVNVSFAGDSSFSRSDDTATVDVTVPGSTRLVVPPVPPLHPGPGSAQPAPVAPPAVRPPDVPPPPPAPGAGAQPQVQSQSQVQQQTAGEGQPAAATQQQRQQQLALAPSVDLAQRALADQVDMAALNTGDASGGPGAGMAVGVAGVVGAAAALAAGWVGGAAAPARTRKKAPRRTPRGLH